MQRILTGCLLVFLSISIQAKTIISSSNPDYAGTEIIFYIPADPFTGEINVIGRSVVGDNGILRMEFDNTETLCIYSETGIYKFIFYIEPDKTYNIILPPYQEKTDADKINPYFIPVEVHLAIEDYDQDDLNVQIRMFDDSYSSFLNKHVDNVFNERDFDELDKNIEQLEKPFAKSKNEYFNHYRYYKYGMLRFLAFQQKSREISDQYFVGKPVLYHNPAYSELFNKLYFEYFIHFARADADKLLAKAIGEQKSYSMLKKALQSDSAIKPDELLNMVILKELHDEFYDDNYSRSGMLAILDTFLIDVSDQNQLEIAQNIRDKVTRLLVGFDPPSFKLYNSDSIPMSLSDFKGKFVYLNFCTCFSYTCINEFELLKTLYENHKDYLEIVSLIADDDVEIMKDFVTRRGYSWTFLHIDSQSDLLTKYDIRAFPTYYFVDQQGKLLTSPAPSPNDNFEQLLLNEVRAKGILDQPSKKLF